MKKLTTKLPATLAGKEVGCYTASIGKDNKDITILRITPCEGTAGYWTYRLETLLKLDSWGDDRPPSNVLCIDFGQGWVVTNMIALYREIINEEILI